MDEDREGLVLMLLEEGSTGHAIEMYREETGVDLEHAKRAVAELARQHGIEGRRTRWLPLFLVGLAGLLSAMVAF
jgi:hypothetical protein